MHTGLQELFTCKKYASLDYTSLGVYEHIDSEPPRLTRICFSCFCSLHGLSVAGEKALLDDAVLRSITGGMDVLSIFQMLSAQIAASCMKLAACIRDSAEQKVRRCSSCFPCFLLTLSRGAARVSTF